ncbi:MAG: sigma-70 family RNA polymerase sigma factor [Syntrophomonas sp.]
MEKDFAVYLQPELYMDKKAVTDTEIFAQIFDRFYKRIYNYIRYRIGDTYEAEDLTSQVFEQVLRKYDTYRPEKAPFEVWLFAIAHHAVTDYHRKRKHSLWFSLDKVKELISGRPTPEEACLREENRHELLLALAKLGDRERNIIAMRFAANLKNREIASLLGISENNVGIIVYRTLRQLREILSAKEGNHERV